MEKEVMILTGAGQIGMAIARRMGYGKKIILGDKKLENAEAIAKIMNEAGFDVLSMEMDLSSRESILNLIAELKDSKTVLAATWSVMSRRISLDIYFTASLECIQNTSGRVPP